MILNAPRSIKVLLEAIAIAAICCLSASPGNAQIAVEPTKMRTAEAVPETSPESIDEEPLKQRSYIGLGGAIGLQGNTTSLSDGAFSIVSKQVLGENFAIHTADTVFGRSTASSSLALTYNHPIRDENLPILFIPFVGGGVMLHSDNGIKVSPLVTAGIDIDTPANVTGTVRINSGFIDDRKADVGIIFGVGYNY